MRGVQARARCMKCQQFINIRLAKTTKKNPIGFEAYNARKLET